MGDKLERFKGKSKHELALSLESLRKSVKKANQLGGIGPSVVTAGTGLVVRHAHTSLVGPAKSASTADRIISGVLCVGAAGIRIGIGERSAKTGTVMAAAVAEGVCFGELERLLEGLASLNPD